MEFLRNQRVKPLDTEVRKSKVVSIPVHFVSSNSTRLAAAGRIQKVLRGFVVRKSMKKIVSIKKEVDEIEMKLLNRETVGLIRKDGKERLRMSEMLMALLFRLDSISGLDLGVRVCRKSLIKKAIVLQERLDAIVEGKEEELKESVEEEDPMEEAQKSDMIQGVGQTDGHREDEVTSLTTVDDDSIEDSGLQNDCVAAGEKEEEGKVDRADTMETEEGAEEIKVTVEAVTAAGEEAVDEMKVIMEKMIEKNEMLIKMVADLCEKNKLQTEMLNSLSKRVSSLEKKQRSKSKKRRQASKICFDD